MPSEPSATRSSISLEPLEDAISYSEVERWVSLASATALIAFGFSRRTLPGLCLAVVATALAYRGVSGTWPRFNTATNDDTRVALSGSRGIHVRDSVRLERPVAEVYRFWRTLENLPRFMTHLKRVTELDDGRSHWEARGPADITVEWDAEIINEVADKVLGPVPLSQPCSAGTPRA